ncbi:MAG TPA: MraY family glycosyltransferase, partial [Spirochaetia bacterium]
MNVVLLLVVAGVVALAGSVVVTPIVLKVSHRREWYDIPNDRKIHTSPIPRLGGVGIVVGLLLAALCVPLVVPFVAPGLSPFSYDLRAIPLFLAFAVIHAMGLVDDFHNLDALLKFLIQIVAAVLVTVAGYTISSVGVPGAPPIHLGILAYPVTVLWLVAISNAMNLVDGVDGLAGGIGAIAAIAMAVICLVRGAPMPALVAVALVGALIGFLFFNFPAARIFMGDSGSLTVGFVLATIPLLVRPGATSVNELLAPGTVLLLPILDTLAAIVRRLRQG